MKELNMYPSYSQFPQHIIGFNDKPSAPMKKISVGSSNPYSQLNQMLSYQIKQAKLKKLNGV